MAYKVKEIFYTLQGEGNQAGRPSVFLRFTGCNLWTGREKDRANAICQFCDTDFRGTDGVNGGVFKKATDLAVMVKSLWAPSGYHTGSRPYVVCTGGEPLLQLDIKLIKALHEEGFEIAVETNGTIPVPPGIDWICMSPKANTKIVVTSGQELKLIFPQPGAEPELYEHLDFRHFYLQPMDNTFREYNTQLTLHYCLEHPQWKLSLQTHKLLGIP